MPDAELVDRYVQELTRWAIDHGEDAESVSIAFQVVALVMSGAFDDELEEETVH